MSTHKLTYAIALLTIFKLCLSSSVPCLPKDFGLGSTVCVCNSTYCDTLDPLEKVPLGTYFLLSTSKSGHRFVESNGDMQTPDQYEAWDIEVTVNRNKQYQSMIGFGGAFTDASGINIAKLDDDFQTVIIKQYYGPTGLEYNIGRVPMGGSDFSARPYSYDDDFENDTTLSHFNLTEEDLIYKIPYIKQALEIQPNMKLFASVWSAPKWMKTNNDFRGIGSLKTEYYSLWADYFVKFLDEYAQRDLTFWAITTQNEPLHGEEFDFNFNCMGWSAEEQRDWIKHNLGPTLLASNHKDIKIIMYDDQRLHLNDYTRIILRDPEAAKYISGIGVHWYTDAFTPPKILEATHYDFPEYFILGTEACAGAMPFSPAVSLGSWSRAVNYASDIISDLNNFMAGWVDWNLLLDLDGGPNWAENYVDSPMIVDSQSQLVYKQPLYYALGHFSKFIPNQSVRIQHKFNNQTIRGLEVLTCLRPDSSVVVVLLNRLDQSRKITIKDLDDDRFIQIEVQPNSLSTVVYTANEPVIPSTTVKDNMNNSESKAFSATSVLSICIFITYFFAILLII